MLDRAWFQRVPPWASLAGLGSLALPPPPARSSPTCHFTNPNQPRELPCQPRAPPGWPCICVQPPQSLQTVNTGPSPSQASGDAVPAALQGSPGPAPARDTQGAVPISTLQAGPASSTPFLGLGNPPKKRQPPRGVSASTPPGTRSPPPHKAARDSQEKTDSCPQPWLALPSAVSPVSPGHACPSPGQLQGLKPTLLAALLAPCSSACQEDAELQGDALGPFRPDLTLGTGPCLRLEPSVTQGFSRCSSVTLPRISHLS